MASDLHALRPEFDKAGARLTIVSAIDTGADAFMEAVWPNGELYIDEAEAFKDALGGQGYKNIWLLKPSVLKDVVSFARRFGTSTSDITDEKTQKLGGVFVVVNKEVVYVHRETERFDNGDANDVLKAVLGYRGGARPDDGSSTTRVLASNDECSTGGVDGDGTTGVTACMG